MSNVSSFNTHLIKVTHYLFDTTMIEAKNTVDTIMKCVPESMMQKIYEESDPILSTYSSALLIGIRIIHNNDVHDCKNRANYYRVINPKASDAELIGRFFQNVYDTLVFVK